MGEGSGMGGGIKTVVVRLRYSSVREAVGLRGWQRVRCEAGCWTCERKRA